MIFAERWQLYLFYFSFVPSLNVNICSFRSSSAKIRGGQVNKLVQVQGLELYCDTVIKTDGSRTENSIGRERLELNKYSSILAPLDVSISLSVSMCGFFNSLKEYYYVILLL